MCMYPCGDNMYLFCQFRICAMSNTGQSLYLPSLQNKYLAFIELNTRHIRGTQIF